MLRTKYLWLTGPERRKQLPRERKEAFAALRDSSLKVGRAWAMKEAARELWSYAARGLDRASLERLGSAGLGVPASSR